MPSGPANASATSPSPGVDVQPSGTLMVILGAAGSATVALVGLPTTLVGGRHSSASGGMCPGSVVSTPGTPVSGSGCVGPATPVEELGAFAETAFPAVVSTQLARTAATRAE